MIQMTVLAGVVGFLVGAVVTAAAGFRPFNWMQARALRAEAACERERLQFARELHAKDAVIAAKNGEIGKLVTQVRRMSER